MAQVLFWFLLRTAAISRVMSEARWARRCSCRIRFAVLIAWSEGNHSMSFSSLSILGFIAVTRCGFDPSRRCTPSNTVSLPNDTFLFLFLLRVFILWLRKFKLYRKFMVTLCSTKWPNAYMLCKKNVRVSKWSNTQTLEVVPNFMTKGRR